MPNLVFAPQVLPLVPDFEIGPRISSFLLPLKRTRRESENFSLTLQMF